MKKKVILILADGFRPDAFAACGNPYVEEFLKLGKCSLDAQTVYPSVTLPCHMSLFHSIQPDRHGILTNTYVPQVRPVNGLCEQLAQAGRSCAFFYNWEELRDLSRPSSLAYSFFVSGQCGYEKANEMVTQNALAYIEAEEPDFAFVYLGMTDDAGHRFGWMGEEYLEACRVTMEETRRIVDCFSHRYTILFTADHGGHDRTHGSMENEDMKIPLVCIGPDFVPGAALGECSIMDIAPTITQLLDASPAQEWEGRSLLGEE